MKKLTFMLSALCLLVIVSCSKDTEINEPTSVSPNFKVTEYTAKSGTSNLGNKNTEFDVSTLGGACYTTDLIAGQNMDAGDVSVYNAGEKMYIVYTTSGDWTLKNTHLSVGNCIETIPTTGSGNPKVGQFEKSWEFVSYSNTNDESDVIQVVYEFDQAPVFASVIPGDVDLGDYCFAAHAVVQAGSNETAWAGSLTPDADLNDRVKSFDGNNWAMLVKGDYGDACTSNGGGGDTE